MAIRRFSTAEPGVKSNRFWDQDTQQGAMEPITFSTITSSGGGWNITNIPQNYQDLRIVVNARSITNATTFGLYAQFNNVFSGSLYSYTGMYSDGSTTLGFRSSSRDDTGYGEMPALTATAGVFGVVTMDILNYSGTSNFKTILSRMAGDRNGSGFTYLNVNNFRSTSGISSIKIGTSGYANLESGSTIALYGIKAGA